MSGGAPDPNYPGLHAWFDAADGVNGSGQPAHGSSVSAWGDRSGNGHDLLRVDTDPDLRPVFVSAAGNSLPAVEFDGNDFIWGDSTGQFGTLTGAKTILLALEVNSANGGYVFDGTSSTGRNALITGQNASPGLWNLFTGQSATVGETISTGVVQVHSVMFDTTTHAQWINGVLSSNGSGAADDLRGFLLGARYSLDHELSGRVSEVLVYSEALTDTDRAALESYLLLKHPVTEPPPQPSFVDVFDGGIGYPAFRIPSILHTREESLLAFAEGRASLSDHAQNDIVMRRSTDAGATWGALVTLADDGGNSLNNPCVLQVNDGAHEGRIYLMYQRYPQGCHESCVVPGYTGPNICRGFVMHSDDDGLTWSTPADVTTQVKRPTGATSIAGGPGIGIQKRYAPHAGRLIMPFNQGPNPNWTVYAVYSDDGGSSWAWGATSDDSQTPGTGNEVQIVELTDGSLLLNSRSNAGTQHRKTATSFDGGETWTPLADEPQLVEPRCMASVLRYTDPSDGHHAPRLLYAGPNSQTSRVNGTIHLSYDEGQNWTTSKLLRPGFYAYSVLTALASGEIGVLFEGAGYDRITFARFPIEWLTDGLDCVGTIRTTCAGELNSTGNSSTLALHGGVSLSANQSALEMSSGPPGQGVLFFFGTKPANIPFGNGSLCSSGTFTRLGPPQVLDSFGASMRTLDYHSPLLDSAVVNTSLYFQAWYRDPAAGAAGFNFSSGLELRFCP
ncbi:MAG: sialidase-1 [Planctomycetota bacterium]|jgi:sialidase-1